MTAFSDREKHWRTELTKALKKEKKWDEFDARRLQLQQQIMAAGQKDFKIARKKAWHAAAEEFPGVFDTAKFDIQRKETIERERDERKRRALKTSMAQRTGGVITPALDAEVDRMIDQLSDQGPVVIENAVEGDVLRDAKWVYYNLSRVIKTRRNGQRYLDPKTLKEAPSNGAVALAQYALDEPKAFIERFVIKILPKDEAPEKAPTEEEVRAELDPGLDELERYMKKVIK